VVERRTRPRPAPKSRRCTSHPAQRRLHADGIRVEILKVVFHKQHAEATKSCCTCIRRDGRGGRISVRDRRDQGADRGRLSRQSEFPLKCVMKKPERNRLGVIIFEVCRMEAILAAMDSEGESANGLASVMLARVAGPLQLAMTRRKAGVMNTSVWSTCFTRCSMILPQQRAQAVRREPRFAAPQTTRLPRRRGRAAEPRADTTPRYATAYSGHCSARRCTRNRPAARR